MQREYGRLPMAVRAPAAYLHGDQGRDRRRGDRSRQLLPSEDESDQPVRPRRAARSAARAPRCPARAAVAQPIAVDAHQRGLRAGERTRNRNTRPTRASRSVTTDRLTAVLVQAFFPVTGAGRSAPMPAEHQLEDHAGAEVGEARGCREAAERPVHCAVLPRQPKRQRPSRSSANTSHAAIDRDGLVGEVLAGIGPRRRSEPLKQREAEHAEAGADQSRAGCAPWSRAAAACPIRPPSRDAQPPVLHRHEQARAPPQR